MVAAQQGQSVPIDGQADPVRRFGREVLLPRRERKRIVPSVSHDRLVLVSVLAHPSASRTRSGLVLVRGPRAGGLSPLGACPPYKDSSIVPLSKLPHPPPETRHPPSLLCPSVQDARLGRAVLCGAVPSCRSRRRGGQAADTPPAGRSVAHLQLLDPAHTPTPQLYSDRMYDGSRDQDQGARADPRPARHHR